MLKNKYKNLFKFNKYFKSEKKLIILLITVMILASSLGLILPYFYSKRLIAISQINIKTVLLFSILIILVITFHHIFWFLWEKIGSIISNQISVLIKKDLIESITKSKYTKIKDNTSEYYLERITDDVVEVSTFLPNVLGTLVDSLTNISFLVLIFILNYKCGLIFLVGIIILYIIDTLKIKQDLKHTELLKIQNESFSSKIIEDIKGIKDIKGLGIRKTIINSVISKSEEISKTKIKACRDYALYSRIKTYLQYVLEAILIIYSVNTLIPNNEISVVILLMIIDYSGFMYDLVGFVATMKDHFIKGEYKAERLLEILEKKEIDTFGKYNKNLPNYSIEVKNLSYSYDNHNVLNDISFKIKENTINLFVGHSGSGKSTLFSILTKILTIPNNKVFIGGIDINDISEEVFRKNICIVNQNPFILNDTIINNIKIVKENATDEEVYNACTKVNLIEDIKDIGFDTIIKENGNNLSGGQLQRISLARALLKDSKIILFDEPTSALDQTNQKYFFDTIKKIKNKTILIISHKYAEVENTYELKNGKIVYN